jgi:uncharacterized delta-60 repeat protein
MIKPRARGSRAIATTTAALALLIAMAAPGVTIPGGLDPGFHADGKVITDFGGNSDGVSGLIIQRDGRIVAVGSAFSWERPEQARFAIARFKPDGSLDVTFGGNGTVVTDFVNTPAQAKAVAIQNDGRIVAVGFSGVDGVRTDFALARYNPDGTLDQAFGNGGRVTTDFPSNDDEAFAVAIQTDGKIVAAGLSRVAERFDFALARYNPDGTLDATFGVDGKVTTDFAGDFDIASAVIIQDDGKIVAGGRAAVPGTIDFALARYTPTGSLDSTFGGDGKMTTDFSMTSSETGDVAEAFTIQPDGRIVAAGYALGSREVDGTITPYIDFALARYNPDGSLDVDFQHDGTVTTDFGSTADTAHALVIQRDRRIVVVGSTSVSGSFDFAVARYKTDGSLDATFGGRDGMITTDFTGGNDRGRAVAIQTDGKIVAAGTADGNFGIARYTVCRRASIRTSIFCD